MGSNSIPLISLVGVSGECCKLPTPTGIWTKPWQQMCILRLKVTRSVVTFCNFYAMLPDCDGPL